MFVRNPPIGNSAEEEAVEDQCGLMELSLLIQLNGNPSAIAAVDVVESKKIATSLSNGVSSIFMGNVTETEFQSLLSGIVLNLSLTQIG